MEESKFRIRRKGETKKGSKFVIEKKVGDKWESRTLIPSETLWNVVCQDTNGVNVSDNGGKTEENKFKGFGYSLLTEPKIDDKTRTLLWEMTK